MQVQAERRATAIIFFIGGPISDKQDMEGIFVCAVWYIGCEDCR